MVPINTWKPWKPVNIKNKDPKTLSFIENGAILYSYAWINVNKIPYKIVISNPLAVADLSPAKIALWQQVTVIPEDNKIIVFNKGKPHGSNETILNGGQT